MSIYLLCRTVSALFMSGLAHHQPDLSLDPTWFVSGSLPAHPSYWILATNWDGQWYRDIALHGYSTDPRDVTGEISQNTFAFYPLYPLLVGLLVHITGVPFEFVGPTVSLVAGAGAVVLLYRWLSRTRGRSVALVATVVLSAFPSSPTFQMAYSDALAMVFLVLCLWGLSDRQWGRVVVWAIPLALTRPVALPLALVAALWVLRFRHKYPGPTFLRQGLVASAAVGASAFLWPAIVWMLSGSPDTYFRTAASWVQAGGLGGGWVRGLWEVGQPALALAMALLVGALVALRWRRRHDALPDPVGPWAGVYMLYILFTTTMNTSVFRYALLTLVPLGTFGALSLRPLSTRRRLLLLAPILILELFGQYLWVAHVLVVDVSPALSHAP